jgi:hypothetical protein
MNKCFVGSLIQLQFGELNRKWTKQFLQIAALHAPQNLNQASTSPLYAGINFLCKSLEKKARTILPIRSLVSQQEHHWWRTTEFPIITDNWEIHFPLLSTNSRYCQTNSIMFPVLELHFLICYDIFMLSFSSLLLLSGVSEGHPGSLSAIMKGECSCIWMGMKYC